jgi:transcription elongation factor GreA
MAITYMTKEGYKKKMEEIAYLESVKRPEISRAIAEARDKGDLSENAEYDAAKEAQGMLEMKISQLKDLVAQARIIDESKLNTDEVLAVAYEYTYQGKVYQVGEEVQILNRVKIKNVANGSVMEYTIVADSEADLKAKKIASSTPIAQGLIGHKLGEIVEIKVPSGLMKFEIVEISF